MGEVVLNPVWRFDYVLVAGLALLVLGGLVAWWNAARCGWPSRLLVTFLRLLALAVLVVVALNPGRWVEETSPSETEWAILVDDSASMTTVDLGETGESRIEQARAWAEQARELAPDPQAVRLYAFDGDARELSSPGALGELVATGDSTNITLAGQTVLARAQAQGKSLAGIILLTDGRQVLETQPEDFALLARARQTPIYPVPLFGQRQQTDLELRSDRRQYVGFPGQEVQIIAKLKALGLGDILPTVELVNDQGEVMEQRQVKLTEGVEEVLIFTPVPEEPGYREYQLRVKTWAGESNEENNVSVFGLTTLAEPLRILFLEGSPSWDSKFLIQLLRRQPNFKVVSNYRISSDRFFRIETDTADADEAEDNTFPANLEGLSLFDIVIFGKGAEYFMTPERIEMLKEFVRTQGGTVLFSRGKPYHGDLPGLDILEAGIWGAPVNQEFTLRPTLLGVDSGLFEAADSSFWKQLPPLDGATKIQHEKPFTENMAMGQYLRSGSSREFPAVIARRYGQGMSLTLNADGMWKWGFFPQVTQHGVMYDRFWTQLIQWAAIYAEFLPGQKYSLHLSSYQAKPQEPVRVRVERRGRAKANLPLPSVEVWRGEEKVTQMETQASSDHPQRWECILSLSEPGRYRLVLMDAESNEVSRPSRGLWITPPPTEASDTRGNLEFLQELARLSSGRLVEAEDFATLFEEQKPAPLATPSGAAEWQSLWDQTWLLGLMLGCFSLEWIVRRRHGLM